VDRLRSIATKKLASNQTSDSGSFSQSKLKTFDGRIFEHWGKSRKQGVPEAISTYKNLVSRAIYEQ